MDWRIKARNDALSWHNLDGKVSGKPIENSSELVFDLHLRTCLRRSENASEDNNC